MFFSVRGLEVVENYVFFVSFNRFALSRPGPVIRGCRETRLEVVRTVPEFCVSDGIGENVPPFF